MENRAVLIGDYERPGFAWIDAGDDHVCCSANFRTIFPSSI